jgi:hypothetical protein
MVLSFLVRESCSSVTLETSCWTWSVKAFMSSW